MSYQPETLEEYLLLAVNYAAEKHQNQRRKNSEKTPYINHPLRVAQYIAEGGENEIEIWIAAILHDTVEDTDATLEEIEKLFSSRISKLVAEVTDNKSLPKVEREKLQVSHAAEISKEAKLIKMADKLHNLTSFLYVPPAGWSAKEIQGYFVWSKAVMDNCKNVNEYLENKLNYLFNEGKFSLNGDEYDCVPKDVNLDEVLDEYYSSM